MAQPRRSSSYSSPAMRRISRDLEGSRKLAVMARSGVIAKKCSPPRIPPLPAGAPIKKSSAPATPLSRSASITRSPRREHALAQAQAPGIPPPLSSSPASEKIRAGTTVSVRTPVAKLSDGRRLVLWLSAVVVSAAEEGLLTVIYKGNFPPGDLFQTVRVARNETKKMAAAAAAITNSTAARPTSNNAAAPRPTTGSKKLAVLRRIYPEAF